ncbi:MAG TPA: ABC transporter substrate-binding protein [Crocinitomicaceae bacterium]|nr:ABC transporter substrate-binding protein [Crocinitomicaceae bacterium]
MRIKTILASLLIGLTFFSCTEKTVDVDNLVALGGKKYGGDFRFMSAEKITSLATVSSVYHYTSRVVSQIYEPLLTIDMNSLNIVPSIAESFSVNDDATVYTFKIRKRVFFHQDACLGEKVHELDANDVKFSLELACSGLELNKISYLLVNRVKGADKFYENSSKMLPKEGVEGIKVTDNNTVEITLKKPFAGFEYILTHSSLGVFPKEAYDKYGKEIGQHPVGTGPFSLDVMNEKTVILKRNNNYWKKDDFGNQLPYLSRVVVSYADDKRSELLAFRKSEIDLVLEIPVEEVEHILGTLTEAQEGKNIKHKVESTPSMSVRYVALAHQSEEFKNVKIRKAFNIAIDRDAIIDNELEGEGWASHNGFVPKIGNYPTDDVKGFKFNVQKAKALMASAGYPNGKGFPTIKFYTNSLEGSKTHKMCLAISKQLKENIGVNLEVILSTIKKRDELIQKGEAKMWAEGWLADYPDPENFLSQFYGVNMEDATSFANRFNFNNEKFNLLFEQAISEPDPEKRTELIVKCDQLIIDEAATMPIFTDDNTVLVNARVRDFQVNEMESLNLTNVFIKETKK